MSLVFAKSVCWATNAKEGWDRVANLRIFNRRSSNHNVMSLVFAKSVLSSLYKMDGTLLVDGVANMFIFILVQSHLGIGHNWAQLGTIGQST